MNKQISFQEIKNPVRTYIKDSLSHEPIYSLIAIEFLKGKITNPMKDIVAGIVDKDKALRILDLTFDIGVMDYRIYRDFSEKIKNIKV